MIAYEVSESASHLIKYTATSKCRKLTGSEQVGKGLEDGIRKKGRRVR